MQFLVWLKPSLNVPKVRICFKRHKNIDYIKSFWLKQEMQVVAKLCMQMNLKFAIPDGIFFFGGRVLMW